MCNMSDINNNEDFEMEDFEMEDNDELDGLDDNNEPTLTEEDIDDFGMIQLSKHKMNGKHSLEYDIVFKGRKESPLEEFTDTSTTYSSESIEVDSGSYMYYESIDNENYIREKALVDKIFEIIKDKTDINISGKRRIPSPKNFNHYFELIKENTREEGYSDVEIFTNLYVYFSESILNMLKLLNSENRAGIIRELQKHVGKTIELRDVSAKTLKVDTEVQFRCDEYESCVTGIIVECLGNGYYNVNSYEKIHNIHIDNIDRILNPNKLNNLNRLDNIDFL